VGRAVLVFHSNGKSMLEPSPGQQFGMAGRFHAGPLLQELREAALSGRHILLAGPTGTGKELSANALSSMHGKDGKPLHLVVHNAARFTSDEEAASTLFGVGPRVFSNVDARPGVIELAHGGALFLDEVHNLPERVQRSLLRVIEDGLLSRIGETSQRKAHVRFIFASNAEPPTYALAHDLIARLRVVQIPPLAERTADIPNIFKTVLRAKLKEHGISNPEIFSLFGGDHYEAMCLDGFKTNNVRGLVDLADRVATKVVSGKDPMQAILEVFGERFSGGSVVKRHMKDSTTPESNNSYYEKNKGIIVAIYLECDGNVSKTVDSLQSQGIRCSRRWITVFVEKWGLKKKK
jgi:transcriptional regulator with AAA-type ATPase domain